MTRAITYSIVLALAGAAVLGLASCNKPLEAPTDRGVCWALAQLPGGKARFNRLAANQPDLEHCAAQLEIMRLRFRALGSTQTEMTGPTRASFCLFNPKGCSPHRP